MGCGQHGAKNSSLSGSGIKKDFSMEVFFNGTKMVERAGIKPATSAMRMPRSIG